MLLTALLSLTLLPAPAYADGWNVSAGGGGGGGKVGGGRWNDTMQGLRITVITPEGKPAFTFGNDPSLTSLDMLYSVKNTDKIDISMGGCKAIDTFYGPFNNTSAARIGGSNEKALKRGIHQNITAFGYMNDAIGIGRGGTNNPDFIWKVVAPDTRGANKKYKQLSQVKPVDDTGDWRLHGAEIRQLMYGSTDQNEPDKDAAIHVMFNLYNKDTDKPVWQLTSSGKKYLSEDVIKAYEQGLKRKPVCLTTKLMVLGGFAIVVEPIMWGELRNGENSYSGIVLYGTATNIAKGIEELVKNKAWYQSNYKTGGYDVSLYKNTRHSMVLTKPIEYAGQKYTVPSRVKDNSYRVPNKEMLQHTLGWAMHIYVCGGADDKTHTWDNNKYPDKTKYVEHPAPNPKEDPPTKPIIDTVKDKLHYNIVKFYEEEVEDSSSPTGKRINHISTHERIETLPKIQVEDEEKAGGYKVVEWKWSSDPKPAIVTGKKADGATEWTDPMIESLNVKPENKSTPKTRISLVDILFQGASKTEGSCRAG